MQPGVTPGASLELHAAKANGGLSPGLNDPLTTTFFDTSLNGNHATLGSGFTGQSPWLGDGSLANPHRLAMDGVDDLVVSAAFADASAVTVEMWKVRLEDRTGTRCTYQHRGGTPTGGMYMADRTAPGAYWAVTLYTEPLGTVITRTLSNGATLTFGAMNHQMMAVGGTTLKAWCNGTKNLEETIAATWRPSPSVVAQLFSVAGVYTTKDEYAVLRVYPFMLSDPEAAVNYAAGYLWRECPVHLLRPRYISQGVR